MTDLARHVAAPPHRSTLQISRGIAALAITGAAIWPLLNGNTFILTMATILALTLIGATSLHLIIRTGHMSMAHAAFMGVAGYVAAISITRFGLAFPVAMVLGCGASALLALIIGPIVLRLTGKYFVLFTFLLGEIVRMVFVEWSSLTGGSNGLFDLPPISPALLDKRAYYALVLVVAVACIGLVARILSGETGKTIDAIRENENVAKASGVPVLRLKVTIFVIACALAGVQGVLQVFFLRYIDPTTFAVPQSLDLVIINVVGGMYTLLGPIIGTLFIVITPELLRDYVSIQRILFGMALIIVMIAAPAGVAPFVSGVFARLRRRGAR